MPSDQPLHHARQAYWCPVIAVTDYCQHISPYTLNIVTDVEMTMNMFDLK